MCLSYIKTYRCKIVKCKIGSLCVETKHTQVSLYQSKTKKKWHKVAPDDNNNNNKCETTIHTPFHTPFHKLQDKRNDRQTHTFRCQMSNVKCNEFWFFERYIFYFVIEVPLALHNSPLRFTPLSKCHWHFLILHFVLLRYRSATGTS